MNKNIEKYLEVMKDKEGYSKWNFTPDEDGPMVQTGYEDVYDELEKYTYEEYMKDVPEGHSGFEADDTPNQRKLQREIIEIYRSKNIFPIPYYNYNGILNEIQKVINTELEFEGDVISGGAGVGTGLCNFLFPNLYDTVSAKDLTKHKEGAESARKKFYNDDFLKKAIRVAIQYGKSTPQPSSIYSGLGMVGSMPSNFKPLLAKSIYNRFTEVGDTVYDSSCVDDETEFFNGKEWKSIAKYQEGEKVLQYNVDGTSELVNPLKYTHIQNDDPFYMYKNRVFNSCLTGNHRVVFRQRINDTSVLTPEMYEFTQEQIYNLDFRGGVPLSSSYCGSLSINPNLLKLVVAIQADGTIDNFNTGRVRFGFTKERKIERLRSILSALNINYTEKIQGKAGGKDYYFFSFNYRTATDFFEDYSKQFPEKFLELDTKSRQVFLEEVLLWDGENKYVQKEGLKNPTLSRAYYTSNEFNAELVWHLTVTTEGFYGAGFSKIEGRKEGYKPEYSVTFRGKTSACSSYDNKDHYSFVNKKDKYCFTVPSSMLVLRRNHQCFITGNCGFGGRLLGALSSKKNLRYIGCDPNSETQKHLHELGGYIEEVTGRENSFELFEKGSEEFCYGDNTIDFAFSSPPYFDLELYSVEDTQSSMKYPTLESWLEGFVRGTIKNLYRMLKPGKFYCVNIADFTSPSGGICHFVDEWTRISEEEGFERMPNLYLGIPARAGSLEKKLGEMKKENILVFKSRKSFFDF